MKLLTARYETSRIFALHSASTAILVKSAVQIVDEAIGKTQLVAYHQRTTILAMLQLMGVGGGSSPGGSTLRRMAKDFAFSRIHQG